MRNDIIATSAIDRLMESGYLPKMSAIDWEGFYRFREQVRQSFVVPETSITPVMARLFYGISLAKKPKVIVGAGTYYGNALAWLAGPTLMGDYKAKRVLGIDLDPVATDGARCNFSDWMAGDVELICEDATKVFAYFNDEIDLLYLDAEDPVHGKSIYATLLDLVYERLAPEALVLAHDVCVEKFMPQLESYRIRTRDKKRFSKTCVLDVDYCGLELSCKIKNLTRGK